MAFLQIVGNIADFIGILGAMFASLAWYQVKTLRQEIRREKERLNDKVEVVLNTPDGKHKIDLPVGLRREELTRAELLGRIGMIPTKDKKNRFLISHLNSRAFLEDLERIREVEGEQTLFIPCSIDEIEQFNA